MRRDHHSAERTGSLPTGQSVHPDIERTAIRTKVWLECDGRFVVGDGGLRLLEGLARYGSLLEAAREIGWSYRHAWGYLRRAEAALGDRLTVPRAGKGAARGTDLTVLGHALLHRLQAARARVDAAVGPSGPTESEIAARGAGDGPARPPAPAGAPVGRARGRPRARAFRPA